MRKFLRNRKFKVGSLCVALATTFWFFNAMNKNNYNSNINYPIDIVYDDSLFIQVADLPTSVEVNVSGTGWNIMGVYFGFGIDGYTINIEGDKDWNYVLGRDLTYYISSHIGHLNVNYVKNDTIRFNIEPKVFRKVAVSANTNFISDRFKVRFEPKVVPQVVELYGGKSAMSKVPDILYLDIPDLKEGSSIDKKLVDLSSQLPQDVYCEKYSKLEVTAIVDEYVLKSFETKLQLSDQESVSIAGVMEVVKEYTRDPVEKLLRFSVVKTEGDSSRVSCYFDERIIRKLKYSPQYFKSNE